MALHDDDPLPTHDTPPGHYQSLSQSLRSSPGDAHGYFLRRMLSWSSLSSLVPSQNEPSASTPQSGQSSPKSSTAPPSPKKTSPQKFCEVLERWKQKDKEKEEELRKAREKKEQERMKELKPKPTISDASQRLVNYKEEFLQRMESYNKGHRQRREQAIAKRQKDILAHCRPSPEISPQSKQMHRSLDTIVKWREERDKALREKQKKKAAAEAAQLRFAPTLSERSKKLAHKKRKEKNVVRRLSEDSKLRQQRQAELEKAELYPFEPNINPRSKLLYSERPVHERLYSDAVASMSERNKWLLQSWEESYRVKPPKSIEVPARTAELV